MNYLYEPITQFYIFMLHIFIATAIEFSASTILLHKAVFINIKCRIFLYYFEIIEAEVYTENINFALNPIFHLFGERIIYHFRTWSYMFLYIHIFQFYKTKLLINHTTTYEYPIKCCHEILSWPPWLMFLVTLNCLLSYECKFSFVCFLPLLPTI